MKNYLIYFLLITSLSFSQQSSLDISKSKIKWTGKEITTKEHYGSLAFKIGTLTFKNNKPDKEPNINDFAVILAVVVD